MRFFSLVLITLLCVTATPAEAKFKTNARGLDKRNFDFSTSPCKDFYQYANGRWIRRNPIPAAYSSWSLFNEVNERNSQHLRAILEAAQAQTDAKDGSVTQKVGDFYAAAMNVKAIEKAGHRPLKPYLKQVAAISTRDDIKELVIDWHDKGIEPIFGAYAAPDMKKSSKNLLYFTQYGLGLPDRDYYVKKDADSKRIRNQYLSHLARTFRLLGNRNAAAFSKAKRVLDFETKLAQSSLTRVERRNPSNRYNVTTIADANELTPNFDWKTYLNRMGLKRVKKFSIAPPKFFKTFDDLVAYEDVASWKAYFEWTLARNTMPYLSKRFEQAHFDFFNKVLYGQKKMKPRWKRALGVTNRYVGEQLGQLYVKDHFPPKAKKAVLEMLKYQKIALKKRINGLEWMEKKTKSKALKKLASFTTKIGYPDKWSSFKDYPVTRESFVGNVLQGKHFELHRQFKEVGKSVNKHKWGMNPQRVNAYYNPTKNEIAFPAGILQPPFFDAEADMALNFGSIGAVIGHEIMHGFDDKGSKYDGKGNYKNWWTDNDRKEFDKRTEVLVAQFGKFRPLPGYNVNGKLTLGENIGDLGGLTLAYEGFQEYRKKHPEQPTIDGFTPEQRFFLSWAQGWRGNTSRENLKLLIRTNPHSPRKYRVNGVMPNIPEFQEAFQCKEGDAMAYPDEDRAKIW